MYILYILPMSNKCLEISYISRICTLIEKYTLNFINIETITSIFDTFFSVIVMIYTLFITNLQNINEIIFNHHYGCGIRNRVEDNHAYPEEYDVLITDYNVDSVDVHRTIAYSSGLHAIAKQQSRPSEYAWLSSTLLRIPHPLFR